MRTGWDRSGQVRAGQDRSGQVGTGQDRAGQVRTGQDKSIFQVDLSQVGHGHVLRFS